MLLKGNFLATGVLMVSDKIRWVHMGGGNENFAPSGFVFESSDGSASNTARYIWARDADGLLRVHTSKPTSDSDGAAVATGGTGDVTAAAALTNDLLVRGDTASKAVQTTGITVADSSNNMSGVGTLGCGTITIANGSNLVLQEEITFGGLTTENKVEFPDSLADALNFHDASNNSFLKFDSSTPKIILGYLFEAPTACKIGNLTLADGSITDSSNAISFGNEALSTSGDVTLTGDLYIDSDSKKFYLADDGGAYITGDGTNLLFKDQTLAEKTLSELYQGTQLNPIVGGDFTITDGTFTWTDLVDETAATWTFNNTGAGSDVDIITAMTTGEGIHVIANALTTGAVLDIEASSIGAAGALIHLDITVGSHNSTGNFIQCYNGSGDVFEVGKYGATIIAGNATGTDALTLTAGDITLTDGDLTLTTGNVIVVDGYLQIDTPTSADNGHIFTTDDDGTSATELLTITNTAAAFDQALLFIDANATGAIDAVDIKYLGAGAQAVHIDLEAATGDGIKIETTVGSSTGQSLVIDLGAWLGTAGQGAIDIRSDAGAVAEAGHAIYIDLKGSAQDAAAISGKGLFIKDDGDSAGGSYLVHLESTNCDALYVAAGNVMIADNEALIVGDGSEYSLKNDGTATDLTITGAHTIGDGGSSNYVSFAANTGLMTFLGTARPTGTMYFDPNDFVAVSGPVLALVPTSSANGWRMDSGSAELIVTSGKMPANYAASTDFTVKVYYCADDATTKDVKLDSHIMFLTDGTDNVSTGSYVSDTVTDTMAGAAYVLNVATITIANADVVAGEHFILKIERDGADGVDTLDGKDIYITGVEISYIKGSV